MVHSQLLAVKYNLTGPGVVPIGDGTASTEKIVSNVIGVLTIVAVVFFAIQIILAGYAFLTTEGDTKKMEEARKRLTEGVLGLTLVIVAVGFASLIAKIAGLGPVFDLSTMFNSFNTSP